MSKPAIIAIGEPMIEFNQSRQGGEYQQGFGGDTSNFVIAAARQGASSAYITRLGDDPFGKMLLQLWQREGVDTSGVRIDRSGYTAVYFVTHNEQGHAFTYLRGGSAASCMTMDDLSPELIRHARYLHISGVSQAISTNACDTVFAAIDIARNAGVSVCYDPNLRLKLWPLQRARAIIRATVELSDYFLPSLDDARDFTGLTDTDAVLDWCFAAGAKTVVLKLGADGVILADETKRWRIEGIKVAARDATGAGDCFAGAFVARLAEGDAPEEAVRYANAAAALTTTGFGAVAPIPGPDNVWSMLKQSALPES